MWFRILVFISSLSFTACAPRDAGFGDVRRLVQSRLGLPIVWNQSEPEAGERQEKVKALLSRPLTQELAVEIALINNRSLAAQFEQLGIGRAAILSSRPQNPSVEVEFGHSSGLSSHYEFGFHQDIASFLHLIRERKVSTFELEATKQRVASRVLALSLDVRKAVIQLQAMKQIVSLLEEDSLATAAALELTKKLSAAGNVTDLDLNLAEASFEEAKLALHAAQLSRTEANEKLMTLLGLWHSEHDFHLAEQLPASQWHIVNVSELEAKALEANLELQAIRNEINAFSEAVGLARQRAWLPSLELGVKATVENGDAHQGPILGLGLPVFDMGGGQIEEAQARYREAHHRYHATAVNLRSLARVFYQRAQASFARAQRFQTVILPLRRSILSNAQLEFNAMHIGVFRLLDAKRDQTAAELRAVKAQKRFWERKLELQTLLLGYHDDVEVMASETRNRARQHSSGRH